MPKCERLTSFLHNDDPNLSVVTVHHYNNPSEFENVHQKVKGSNLLYYVVGKKNGKTSVHICRSDDEIKSFGFDEFQKEIWGIERGVTEIDNLYWKSGIDELEQIDRTGMMEYSGKLLVKTKDYALQISRKVKGSPKMEKKKKKPKVSKLESVIDREEKKVAQSNVVSVVSKDKQPKRKKKDGNLMRMFQKQKSIEKAKETQYVKVRFDDEAEVKKQSEVPNPTKETSISVNEEKREKVSMIIRKKRPREDSSSPTKRRKVEPNVNPLKLDVESDHSEPDVEIYDPTEAKDYKNPLLNDPVPEETKEDKPEPEKYEIPDLSNEPSPERLRKKKKTKKPKKVPKGPPQRTLDNMKIMSLKPTKKIEVEERVVNDEGFVSYRKTTKIVPMTEKELKKTKKESKKTKKESKNKQTNILNFFKRK